MFKINLVAYTHEKRARFYCFGSVLFSYLFVYCHNVYAVVENFESDKDIYKEVRAPFRSMSSGIKGLDESKRLSKDSVHLIYSDKPKSDSIKKKYKKGVVLEQSCFFDTSESKKYEKGLKEQVERVYKEVYTELEYDDHMKMKKEILTNNRTGSYHFERYVKDAERKQVFIDAVVTAYKDISGIIQSPQSDKSPTLKLDWEDIKDCIIHTTLFQVHQFNCGEGFKKDIYAVQIYHNVLLNFKKKYIRWDINDNFTERGVVANWSVGKHIDSCFYSCAKALNKYSGVQDAEQLTSYIHPYSTNILKEIKVSGNQGSGLRNIEASNKDSHFNKLLVSQRLCNYVCGEFSYGAFICCRGKDIGEECKKNDSDKKFTYAIIFPDGDVIYASDKDGVIENAISILLHNMDMLKDIKLGLCKILFTSLGKPCGVFGFAMICKYYGLFSMIGEIPGYLLMCINLCVENGLVNYLAIIPFILMTFAATKFYRRINPR